MDTIHIIFQGVSRPVTAQRRMYDRYICALTKEKAQIKRPTYQSLMLSTLRSVASPALWASLVEPGFSYLHQW